MYLKQSPGSLYEKSSTGPPFSASRGGKKLAVPLRGRRLRFRNGAKRRGVATVEAAVVLPLVLVGIFAILDLAIMVLRQNALTATASNIARLVSIRGKDHPMDVWEFGAAPSETTVGELDEAHTELQPLLPTVDGWAVQADIQWPEGENKSGYPAQIHLTYTHQSILGPIAPWHQSALSAETSVTIIN